MRVLRSEFGDIFIWDNGFIASRENGNWLPGSAFDSYELSEFTNVTDNAEAELLKIEALEALK